MRMLPPALGTSKLTSLSHFFSVTGASSKAVGTALTPQAFSHNPKLLLRAPSSGAE